MTSFLTKFFNFLLTNKNAKRNSFLFGLFIFIFESILLVSCAYIDDTFYLPNGGRGLFQLYSIWGILFGELFLFYILALLVSEISFLDRKTPVIKGGIYTRYLRKSKKQILDFLSIKKGRVIFFYLFFAGVFFWINNAYQTMHPEKFYGNDLYDSIYHSFGYFAIRLIFLLSWTIFVPYFAYSNLIISFSLWTIFKKLKKNRALYFNIYHPDLCGGFSYLGNINVYFILGILIIYAQLGITLATHHRLNPGLFLGFVLATALFLVATFMITIPINYYLKKEEERLKISMYKNIMKKNRLLSVIARYVTIEKVRFSPYPLPQKIFVYLARLTPVAIGIAKFVIR